MLAAQAPTGRVLVVEDDVEIAEVLRRTLRGEGHEVRAAADGEHVGRGGDGGVVLEGDGDVHGVDDDHVGLRDVLHHLLPRALPEHGWDGDEKSKITEKLRESM